MKPTGPLVLMLGLARAFSAPYDKSFIDQVVDHGCGAPCGTFQQQFIFNASLDSAGNVTPPVFVIVGGEYPVEQWWDIMYGEVWPLAVSEGAVVVALEHRFFGSSYPTPGLLSNLTSLDPIVAAADVQAALPSIQAYLFSQLGVNVAPAVLFGCSYSGTVAAYSHASPGVVGAVASSSPVQPDVAMESYHASMFEAFSDPLAGGSASCGDFFAAAFSNATASLANGAAGGPGFSQFSSDWNVCGTISNLDDARFTWYLIVDLYFGATYVQENAGVYIPFICSVVEKSASTGASPQETFQDVLAIANSGQCTPGGDGEFEGYIASVAEKDSDSSRSDRQWWWLQCAKVGWLHTCTEDGVCPFAIPGFDALPLEWYMKICTGAFNVTLVDTQAGVDAIQAAFGGQDMDSDNIFAVNGADDPWRVYGLLPPPNATRVVVDGGWHCSDMGAPTEGDPESLTAARQAVAAQVRSWLS